MCRELNREPAWIGAIRLALTQGEVTPDAVIEEANLREDMVKTVEDVLATMARRRLLVEGRETGGTQRFVVGPVLVDSAPSASAIDRLSDRALHRWGSPRSGSA